MIYSPSAENTASRIHFRLVHIRAIRDWAAKSQIKTMLLSKVASKVPSGENGVSEKPPVIVLPRITAAFFSKSQATRLGYTPSVTNQPAPGENAARFAGGPALLDINPAGEPSSVFQIPIRESRPAIASRRPSSESAKVSEKTRAPRI